MLWRRTKSVATTDMRRARFFALCMYGSAWEMIAFTCATASSQSHNPSLIVTDSSLLSAWGVGRKNCVVQQPEQGCQHPMGLAAR